MARKSASVSESTEVPAVHEEVFVAGYDVEPEEQIIEKVVSVEESAPAPIVEKEHAEIVSTVEKDLVEVTAAEEAKPLVQAASEHTPSTESSSSTISAESPVDETPVLSSTPVVESVSELTQSTESSSSPVSAELAESTEVLEQSIPSAVSQDISDDLDSSTETIKGYTATSDEEPSSLSNPPTSAPSSITPVPTSAPTPAQTSSYPPSSTATPASLDTFLLPASPAFEPKKVPAYKEDDEHSDAEELVVVDAGHDSEGPDSASDGEGWSEVEA